jgi:hypothetical protein
MFRYIEKESNSKGSEWYYDKGKWLLTKDKKVSSQFSLSGKETISIGTCQL